MDVFFRLATLSLHILRFGYWIVAEQRANQEKAKTEKTSVVKIAKRLVAMSIGLLMATQLLGLQILPFQNSLFIQTLGFFLVVIGIYVAISARKTLGANWAHAAEFQIRKDHSLITTGIYRYIRHPLYTGMFLAVLGAEIVVESYLFVPFIICGIIYFFIQAKQEEKLLLKEFGTEYRNYMRGSAMFLPFVW